MSLCFALVCKNKVLMAADTLSSCGDIRTYIRDDGPAKIYPIGKMLAATAGNVAGIQIVEGVIKKYSNKRLDKNLIIEKIIPDITTELKNNKQVTDDGVDFPTLLLAQGKKLYRVGSNYCVRIIDSMAIGCGDDYTTAYVQEMRTSKDPLQVMIDGIKYASTQSRSIDGEWIHYADTKNLKLEVIKSDRSI